MKDRGEDREQKRAINLQSAYKQEPRKFVRKSSGLCINSDKLTTI